MNRISIFRDVSGVVSVAMVGALASGSSPQGVLPVEPGVGLDRSSKAEACVPVVIEGFVLEPGGAPTEGAVVMCSAGGRAVTDGSGSFRLEVMVPPDADRVEVSAVGPDGDSFVTGKNLGLSGASGIVQVGALLLATAPTCVCPQSRWVPTFGERPGTGNVQALAAYDDGSGEALYVGGYFNGAGGTAADKIARWDGSRWSALGSGLSGGSNLAVYALTVYDDGGGPALYAGGSFTTAGGVAANRVAEWDGSNWSVLGSGTNGIVDGLTVFDDGSGPALYAGGSFTTAGGVAANRVAKWNGSSWAPLGTGMDSSVDAFTVFDDGSGPALYAGGSFTTAGGVAANRVAKWGGSSWAPLGTGMNSSVDALTVFDDGSGPALYAGGSFTTAGGVAANHVAKWDGSSWSALGSGIDPYVRALTAYDDGSGPTLYAAVARWDLPQGRVAKWDGSSWSIIGEGHSSDMEALLVLDEGSGPALYAGGSFLFMSSVVALGVARWDGSTWSGLGAGLDDDVQALTVYDDGSGPALYAGGEFIHVGGTAVNRIVRWDGSSWSPLGSGMSGQQAVIRVMVLTVFDDGGGPALFAGGSFTMAGGVGANNVAKWDGSSWSALGSGMSGGAGNVEVRALTVFDDGGGPALYAGGGFTTAGGVGANYVAKWDGSSWSALGTGMNFPVHALAVFDDGSGPALYAGGRFTIAGGVNAFRIARWDGSWWSALLDGRNNGVNNYVNALTVFDDGHGSALYAGGEFTNAGSKFTNHIARWDGWTWSVLGSAMNTGGYVNALTVHDDGSGTALYAGGGFTSAGGVATNRIAKWDGSSWGPLGSGTTSSVFALAVYDDGGGPALCAGGAFVSAFDSGDSYLARWGCTGDTRPPTLFCPTSVLVGDRIGSPPGEVVTFSVTATDCIDPAPIVVCMPPSGSFFPRGKTIVTCTATDASGNQSTCEFPVTVAQGIRPPPR